MSGLRGCGAVSRVRCGGGAQSGRWRGAVVVVINADTTLHFCDLRAAERTFQLVTQVAGRTGRGDKGGRVLVQTFSPDHYAIEAAIDHDYARFAAAELPSRQAHLYPPFASLIRCIVRGESEPATEQLAKMAG